MMEYTASNDVKQAMERAHAARSEALFKGLSWLFRLRKPRIAKSLGTGFSRWA